MRQIYLFVLFLGTSFDSPAQQTPSIRKVDQTTVNSAALDKIIVDLMQSGKVHGLTVSIFNDKKAVYKKAFGYARNDRKDTLTIASNMYGASLSKALFAVLVLKLAEDGKLDLDKPLQSYLPKPIFEYSKKTKWHDHYDDLKTDTLYREITARMCLSHTSGFPNWRWFETDQKLRVNFKPGSRYQYSGEGMVYLQVVLEHLFNTTLEALARQYVFGPAGMTHTSYQWQAEFESDYAVGHQSDGSHYDKDKDNEPRAPSTLETTADDYTKFLEAVLQDQLLGAAGTRLMFSDQVRIRTIQQFGPQSTRDTTAWDGIRLGYGLGWGVFHTPAGKAVFKEGHGDGFQHYTVLFPETGQGILIMSNSDNAESIFKYLLERCIGNYWTPWYWENYIPYDYQTP
jgi:serine-type D-Ala-D-Ala carboxypeptidase/endopeptidase